ncbi:MAG: hypothetical protein ACM3NV_03090 [Syntrophothermus sp.]
MSGGQVSLVASVFLASAVEAVEAFTIVLAVGTTRRWSAALLGAAAASVALALIVVALGPALTQLPISILRLVVGGLLLVFGMQWLRKAILRAGGAKAPHDELEAFAAEEAVARARPRQLEGLDSYAFAICFKAVLLEGLEVAFIVLTFGSNREEVPLAALAAVLALAAVIVAGIAARAPLARVPENTMKFGVGVLLTTFGIFWGAEGAGASWPGGEAAVPALAAVVLGTSLLMVRDLRRRLEALPAESLG